MRFSKRFGFNFFFFFTLILVSCNSKKEDQEVDSLFNYKAYISTHTYGKTSINEPILISFNKPWPEVELNQEVADKYLEISPAVKGKLYLENGKKLIFKPQEKLKANTTYFVTIPLDLIYKDISNELKSYTFSFKTLEQNYKLNLGNLQSYNDSQQYLTGQIETADVAELDQVKQILKVKQKNQELPIIWEENLESSQYFRFKIDNITRYIKDSQLKITYDGSPIQADYSGKDEYLIPGKDNFKIVDIQTHSGAEAALSLNFSDQLDPNQNFQGLVKLAESNNLKFEVEGNVLYVYPNIRPAGEVLLEVFAGIKNSAGFKLKNTYTKNISFEELKPAVRLISKGNILPASDKTPIYFETVNLRAVDVRVIKIYKDNVLDHLQDASLGAHYNLKRVGRKIAQKTIVFENNTPFALKNWKAHALNLSDFFKSDPGALYSVEISFRQEYSNYDCGEQENQQPILQAEVSYPEENYREEQYWNNELYNWRKTPYNWRERNNPCSLSYYEDDRFATINILGSDLGLIVKEGTDNTYHISANNLLNTQPESKTKVSLYNYQKQLLSQAYTNKNGQVKLKSKQQAAFVVAQKGKQYAYAKLSGGNALSLSKFDISGQEVQGGLKGFIYTERGVHRPGDTIHLNFVLNDIENPLPKKHPVQLSVFDARGQLVLQENKSEFSHPTQAINNFYYFPIPTKEQDVTGNWQAQIKVGGASFSKTLKVATVKPNRLKINLDFGEKVLSTYKPLVGSLQSNWLHGAVAKNLEADIEVELSPAAVAFPQYKSYIFQDPVRKFESITKPWIKDKIDHNGRLDFKEQINLNKNAPGMLEANFLTKVYEGGGDFSIDVKTKKLAPYTHFIGIKSPESKAFGAHKTDAQIPFDIISLNAKGQVAPSRKLKVYVYKIEWRWWWIRGRSNLSRYENTQVHSPFLEKNITTDSAGKGSLFIKVPENQAGRYLIRVVDSISGHATGVTSYFFKDYYSLGSNAAADAAKMLLLKSDQDSYEVGEKARISFPSSKVGRALVSLENGSRVLSQHWVTTNKGKTQLEVPITSAMAPNIYAHITLLQPHAQSKNDLPIRLYGVIPLKITDSKTQLNAVIEMPKELKPEQQYDIRISEKNKREMTYTLAVIDEGLLDLTGFKTPNIHQAFYAREALGVKTYDVYDQVIGAYGGSVNNVYKIGGGELAAGAKNRKADRFKPVVSYLGPFKLKAGQKAKHRLYMPNYVGAVRVMVVAGNPKTEAYGKSEKSVRVAQPLMVLSSLPRKLSPGEEINLPVTVFAMENKIKQVEVSLKLDEALQAIGPTRKKVTFEKPGEQIVYFTFKSNSTSKPQAIKVFAQGHGEKAYSQTEIDIFNPNPVSYKSTSSTLQPKGELSLNYKSFGESGSNSSQLVFSSLPTINLENRLDYLIDYPHGCLEQITSGAFPQLFLSDLVDLPAHRNGELKRNVQGVLNRLKDYQLSNGGFSYWPGQSEAHDWATTYVGHFMIEAKRQGYAIPVGLLDNWMNYQRREARRWQNRLTSYNTSLNQAYRLYALALSGNAELAAMNRLRESEEMSNTAIWRLAAAYAVLGKKSVAEDLLKPVQDNFTSKNQISSSFQSKFRDKAMALETLVLLEKTALQMEFAQSIAKDLSSDRWFSTQETAYALLSLAKMAATNATEPFSIVYEIQGESKEVSTNKTMVAVPLPEAKDRTKINITNRAKNLVFVNLNQQGILPIGEELEEKRNLQLNLQFLNTNDESIAVTKIKQGTSFKAKISIQNQGIDRVEHIALSQFLPSGWEIINTSFTNFGTDRSAANYRDIRDDRVYIYFDLKPGETQTFEIELNASYLGKYYLPGTQVSAMYDRNYFARNKGKWVEVIR
ncbi:MG2 domain-containing protein [Mesonia sediminis]|uniref:MG2 domain-containing protein n=1 Tax=Mesonia sediminis TaxID=1703946 RepID=A0ABW5SFK8_9FLAO